MELDKLTITMREAVNEFLPIAGLNEGKILVVGCSSSEIIGEKIGSDSRLDVGDAIMKGLLSAIRTHNLALAVQCCEHLNRALVIERKWAEKYDLPEVSVIPHLKAGGALAAVTMDEFAHPVVIESISAHAGIDIGDTLIGMHLRPVVVPVRISIRKIGQANLVLARTRPKLIGGERARYART